jgi:hypothetical protein
MLNDQTERSMRERQARRRKWRRIENEGLPKGSTKGFVYGLQKRGAQRMMDMTSMSTGMMMGMGLVFLIISALLMNKH